MIKWSALIVPVTAGAVSAAAVGVGFWDESKQGLLVALSVIAAAVLVRLARGLPFTTPDHYEVDEIRALTDAVSQILRSLKALIIVVFATMSFLIIARLMQSLLSKALGKFFQHDPSDAIISGSIGFAIGYVLVRILHVVQGDCDLTRLQSKFIVRAVERKQAKVFLEIEKKGSSTPFTTPDGYGKVVQ